MHAISNVHKHFDPVSLESFSLNLAPYALQRFKEFQEDCPSASELKTRFFKGQPWLHGLSIRYLGKYNKNIHNSKETFSKGQPVIT